MRFNENGYQAGDFYRNVLGLDLGFQGLSISPSASGASKNYFSDLATGNQTLFGVSPH